MFILGAEYLAVLLGTGVSVYLYGDTHKRPKLLPAPESAPQQGNPAGESTSMALASEPSQRQPDPKSVWESLELVDYLVTGSAMYGTGLVFLSPEPFSKLVGGAVIAASLWNGQQRGTLKIVSASVLAVAHPRAFLEFASTSAGAAVKEAISLGGTFLGVVVTTSGAIVGYAILQKQSKK